MINNVGMITNRARWRRGDARDRRRRRRVLDRRGRHRNLHRGAGSACRPGCALLRLRPVGNPDPIMKPKKGKPRQRLRGRQGRQAARKAGRPGRCPNRLFQPRVHRRTAGRSQLAGRFSRSERIQSLASRGHAVTTRLPCCDPRLCQFPPEPKKVARHQCSASKPALPEWAMGLSTQTGGLPSLINYGVAETSLPQSMPDRLLGEFTAMSGCC